MHTYPWTAVVHIECIAIFLWRELCAGLTGDPVTEDALLSSKMAILISVLLKYCFGFLRRNQRHVCSWGAAPHWTRQYIITHLGLVLAVFSYLVWPVAVELLHSNDRRATIKVGESRAFCRWLKVSPESNRDLRVDRVIWLCQWREVKALTSENNLNKRLWLNCRYLNSQAR